MRLVDSRQKYHKNLTGWSKLSSRIYQNAFQALGKAFSRWPDPEQKAEMPTPKTKKSQQKFTTHDSCLLTCRLLTSYNPLPPPCLAIAP
jgi:hypothetical protein